jgi:hypothetical protein
MHAEVVVETKFGHGRKERVHGGACPAEREKHAANGKVLPLAQTKTGHRVDGLSSSPELLLYTRGEIKGK